MVEKAAILTIGNELLDGRIHDQHAQFCSSSLRKHNIICNIFMSVRDNLQAILEALAFLKDKVDLIITTGGLGPTHDDVTKEALCAFLNDTLVMDAAAEAKIRSKSLLRHKEVTDIALSQAFILKSSTPIENPLGLAPGIYVENPAGTSIASFPGVPTELRAMFPPFVEQLKNSGVYEEEIDVVVEKLLESEVAKLLKEFNEELCQEKETLSIILWGKAIRICVKIRTRSESETQLRRDKLQDKLFLILEPWLE